MEILLFRAALAPVLVLIVSVVGRRLGPRLGGRLLGAPTTTGPFLFVLCISAGASTAAGAAHGSAAGQLTVTCFCLAYGRFARGRRPLPTLLIAVTCSALAAFVAATLDDIGLTAALSLLLVTVGLLTWPSSSRPQPKQTPTRRWELPARMAISAAMVVGSTEVALAAGPFIGGIASSLPVLLSVMGPSAHRASDALADELMHGALISCLATISFLTVVAFTLQPLGLLAFPLALGALVLADCYPRALVALA
ncbi:MAG TPA: hypothetical protein VFN97_11475 [Actinospica sp.]|nr:hypothetical protein [Actinospica sp.]